MLPDPETGWPFWWRWVVATNLGWFPGIFLGLWIADRLPADAEIDRAVLAAFLSSLCFGAAQALVLRDFLERPIGWWLGTVLGWSFGVGLARAVLADRTLDPLIDAIVVAGIAGFVVGLPQALLLTARIRGAIAWPIVSAIGWGVLFPGALPGIALVWLHRARRGAQRQPAD